MTKDNAQVFSGTTNEDVRLEDLGYEHGIQHCSHCSYVHSDFEQSSSGLLACWA